jgi:hypothetical protein
MHHQRDAKPEAHPHHASYGKRFSGGECVPVGKQKHQGQPPARKTADGERTTSDAHEEPQRALFHSLALLLCDELGALL